MARSRRRRRSPKKGGVSSLLRSLRRRSDKSAEDACTDSLLALPLVIDELSYSLPTKARAREGLKKYGWGSTVRQFLQHGNVYVAGCRHDKEERTILKKFAELQRGGKFCTLVLEDWGKAEVNDKTLHSLLEIVGPRTRVRLMDARKIVLRPIYMPVGKRGTMTLGPVYTHECPPQKVNEAIEYILDHWTQITNGEIAGTPDEVRMLLENGLLREVFRRKGSHLKSQKGASDFLRAKALADVSGFLFDAYAVAGALAPCDTGGLAESVMIVCGSLHVKNVKALLVRATGSRDFPDIMKRTQDEVHYQNQASKGLLLLKSPSRKISQI